MPTKKNKPSTYHGGNRRFKSFGEAAAYAVDFAVQNDTDFTIVENNPNTKETFFITVTARASDKP
jgi:hypothetical protein